jgi:uncharacterized protein YcgL (UPF0745 family)
VEDDIIVTDEVEVELVEADVNEVVGYLQEHGFYQEGYSE